MDFPSLLLELTDGWPVTFSGGHRKWLSQVSLFLWDWRFSDMPKCHLWYTDTVSLEHVLW